MMRRPIRRGGFRGRDMGGDRMGGRDRFENERPREEHDEHSEQPASDGGEAAELHEHAHRSIVIPGEYIDDKKGRKLGDDVYEEGEKVFAKVMGIPVANENEIKIIPMSGVYIPNISDNVIGVITEVGISGWTVDINSPYIAFMPVADGVDEFVDTNRTDISRFFDVGDALSCKISKVTKNKTTRVSMRAMGARKLLGGSLMKVKPVKIPRIIGKGGSMINMIKQRTGCVIYVGKNGVIWLRGDNKAEAIEAILTIERESHTSGLTDKISRMLEGLPGAVQPAAPTAQATAPVEAVPEPVVQDEEAEGEEHVERPKPGWEPENFPQR
ncbi:MAG: exosome complex RNA-binding protein Rrp4 [Candidatus Aenigmarchaeota archaeon]|nr:exosome complex RNA-binding protein Rrp4 [Candidatus Aenigmarchaeota archaeon]